MFLEISGAILGGSLSSMILNRCIQRLPRDLSWVKPPECSSCQSALPGIYLIPVIGYFLAKKSCSQCGTALSSQPILVEGLTIGCTCWLLLEQPISWQAVVDLVFAYTLLVIAFIDWNTLRIESRIIVLAICLRLMWLILLAPEQLQTMLTGLLAGAGGLYFVGFFYETVRRRKGLGEGDGAVLGMIGFWVGWQDLSFVVLIASVSGVFLGGSYLWFQKKSMSSTPLPFAPFLCLGGGVMYFLQRFHIPLFSLATTF